VTAHPPRVRWHVETYDPLAREWSSGLPLTDRQAAVKKLARLTEHHPKGKDGAVCLRRIVLETTTHIDLTTDPGPVRLPKGGFVLADHAGQDLAALPGTTPDGRPAIRLVVGTYEVGHAETTVPLDRLEEVIAGLREIARQQGGGQAAADQPADAQPAGALPQLLATTLTERFTALGNPFSRMSINFQGPDGWPASRDVSPNDVADVLRELLGQAGGQPAPGRRRLTELEHTAAWHAIEGTAVEDGADPGTVLSAVLRALNIDPPAAAEGAGA